MATTVRVGHAVGRWRIMRRCAAPGFARRPSRRYSRSALSSLVIACCSPLAIARIYYRAMQNVAAMAAQTAADSPR
jgi:hypothetical protein